MTKVVWELPACLVGPCLLQVFIEMRRTGAGAGLGGDRSTMRVSKDIRYSRGSSNAWRARHWGWVDWGRKLRAGGVASVCLAASVAYLLCRSRHGAAEGGGEKALCEVWPLPGTSSEGHCGQGKGAAQGVGL